MEANFARLGKYGHKMCGGARYPSHSTTPTLGRRRRCSKECLPRACRDWILLWRRKMPFQKGSRTQPQNDLSLITITGARWLDICMFAPNTKKTVSLFAGTFATCSSRLMASYQTHTYTRTHNAMSRISPGLGRRPLEDRPFSTDICTD